MMKPSSNWMKSGNLEISGNLMFAHVTSLRRENKNLSVTGRQTRVLKRNGRDRDVGCEDREEG